MCIEDVRLGRESWSRRNQVTIGAGDGASLVGRNPDRVALLLPNLGPTSSVNIDTQSMTSSAGFFSLANEGLDIYIQRHGQLVTSEWFAFNSGVAPITMTFFEVILQKE